MLEAAMTKSVVSYVSTTYMLRGQGRFMDHRHESVEGYRASKEGPGRTTSTKQERRRSSKYEYQGEQRGEERSKKKESMYSVDSLRASALGNDYRTTAGFIDSETSIFLSPPSSFQSFQSFYSLPRPPYWQYTLSPSAVLSVTARL